MNENGVISFGHEFPSPNPEEFPRPDIPFIAGFWSDIDLSDIEKSLISYIEINSTTDRDTYDRITTHFKNIIDVMGSSSKGFKVTHIFLVTWKEVRNMEIEIGPFMSQHIFTS